MTVARMKNIQANNAYLVRQYLTYYEPSSDTFQPWIGPATVRFCTVDIDAETGVATYNTISGMGPFDLNVGGVAGLFYREIPTSIVNILNAAPYMNTTIYQVVEGGDAEQLADVQPLQVQASRYTYG